MRSPSDSAVPSGLPGDPRLYLEIAGELPVQPRVLPSPTHGSARMATPEELASLDAAPLLPGDYALPEATLAGVDACGATRVLPSVRLPLGPGGGSMHVLGVGQPGVGKSFALVLPGGLAALEAGRSVVALYSKPEEARVLMADARRRGVPILHFNVFDPRRSFGWNPAAGIDSQAKAHDLAHFALTAGDDGTREHRDSPFFFQNGVAWVAGALHLMSRTGGASLPAVARLFGRPLQEIAAAFAAHKAEPHIGGIWSFMASGSQNADTTAAEVQGRLKWLLDESICDVLSHGTESLERLGRRQTLLLVAFQEERMDLARPVNSLFLTTLLNALRTLAAASPRGRLPVPVTILADEFATALGRLPRIENDLHTLRSRGVQFLAAVQSLSQLELVYGRAASSVLAAFTDLLFLPRLAQVDADYASTMLGRTTVAEDTTRRGAPTDADPEGEAISRDARAVPRPLLTPDEVRFPPTHYLLGRPTLVVRSGLRPFWAYLTPLFRQAWARSLLEEAYSPRFRDPTRRRRRGTGRREGAPSPVGPTASWPGPAPGLSDTRGWTPAQVLARIAELKPAIQGQGTPEVAARWWEELERENQGRPTLVLRLAEELVVRKATTSELHLAATLGSTTNLQAALHYLDYLRLKREEDARRKARS